MSELLLYAAPDKKATMPGLLWSGRSDNAGSAALEEILAAKLVTIRQEHMNWAFEIGRLQTESGTLADLLTCGAAPSMWWTSLIYERHPKLSPYLYPIYKLRALELFLMENGYTSLCLSGGDNELAQATSSLCAAHGLKFRQIPGPALKQAKAGKMERLYRATPAPIRALIRFAHWWLTIRRRLPYKPELTPFPPGDKPSATITTYFPNIDLQAAGEGRFRSRYWESLHDALNAEAKAERPQGPHFVRWLFIRFPAPELSLAECISLRNRFQQKGQDGLSFKFLEEFLSTADLWRALGRWTRLCLSSLQLERAFSRACQTRNSRLNFWPWVRWQWRESLAGWRCLERCLQNLAFHNYASKAGIQRWNLFPLENCPWERMFTLSTRSVPGNGPVIGAQHSAVRPTDFRYFDAPETFVAQDFASLQPDIIAGNGASACDQWQANGMPPERMREVEALRYLYLASAKKAAAPVKDLPPEPGEPQKPGTGKRLLILTSFFKDETMALLALLEQAFAQDLLRDWRITLKPHPYFMPTEWLAAYEASGKQRIFVSHSPLALELRAGVAVWTANSTTASLEAALRGLPLLVMAPCNDFDLCPIQNAPGLRRAATIADVSAFLANPEPLTLPSRYFDLNTDLCAWRELLGLQKARGHAAKDESL